jgi:hypothetical protein
MTFSQQVLSVSFESEKKIHISERSLKNEENNTVCFGFRTDKINACMTRLFEYSSLEIVINLNQEICIH